MRSYLSFVLLTIFLRTSLNGFAWEYQLNRGKTITPGMALELPNGDILFGYRLHSFENLFTIYKDVNFHLILLDGSGHLKTTLDVSDFLGGKPALGSSIQLIHDSLFIGAAIMEVDSTFYPAMLVFDNNLNYVRDTVYKNLPNTFLGKFDLVKLGGYLSIGSQINSPFSTRTFIELDDHLNIDSVHSSSDFVFGTNIYQPEQHQIFSQAFNQLYTYDDSTFAITNLISINAGFLFNSSALKLNDTRQLHVGIRDYPDDTRGIMVYEIDSALQIMDSLEIRSPNTRFEPASLVSLTKSEDDIFIGYTSNSDWSSAPQNTTEIRPLTLSKLNADLDIEWTKSYKNDASYHLFEIITTQDKGIVMFGRKYDWLNDSLNTEMDLFVMKVDSSGTPVGMVNPETSSHSNLKVYPNPTQHQFRIATPSNFHNGELSIIDNCGREVQHDTSVGMDSEIDISTLNPGVYTVQFKTENYSGFARLVKEQ